MCPFDEEIIDLTIFLSYRSRSTRLNHVESIVERPAQSSPRPKKRVGRFQSRLHEESRHCREERFTFRWRCVKIHFDQFCSKLISIGVILLLHFARKVFKVSWSYFTFAFVLSINFTINIFDYWYMYNLILCFCVWFWYFIKLFFCVYCAQIFYVLYYFYNNKYFSWEITFILISFKIYA